MTAIFFLHSFHRDLHSWRWMGIARDLVLFFAVGLLLARHLLIKSNTIKIKQSMVNDEVALKT